MAPKKESKCVEDLCVFSGRLEGQSIQTRLFLQSSELGLPTHSPAGECASLLLVGEGGCTLACRRGGDPIRTRGQTQWYSRY
jgi:hypothetical protein